MFKTIRNGVNLVVCTVTLITAVRGFVQWSNELFEAAEEAINNRADDEIHEIIQGEREDLRLSTEALYKAKTLIKDHKVAITFVVTSALWIKLQRISARQLEEFLEEKGLVDEYYLDPADNIYRA